MKTALAVLFLSAGLILAGKPFDSGKATFELSYREETSPYRVNAVFLLPGEVLEIETKDRRNGGFVFQGDTGGPWTGTTAWRWTAPRTAGLHALIVRRADNTDSMVLNAMVMVPVSEMEGESLHGYRIGKYPDRPLKGLQFYRNPTGFIRVDSATAGVQVSPHFRLGQFICKQSPDLPAFLVLRERLILKLEAVLEEANRHGHRCTTFHVMSGYRTPFYNHLIGNVKHSAHQFGGAADVFIDSEPEDGAMDDLNGDGKSDGKDSGILFRIVDKMSLNRFYLPYLGGVGHYSRNRSHGPFVHVDVRGFRATW